MLCFIIRDLEDGVDILLVACVEVVGNDRTPGDGYFGAAHFIFPVFNIIVVNDSTIAISKSDKIHGIHLENFRITILMPG